MRFDDLDDSRTHLPLAEQQAIRDDDGWKCDVCGAPADQGGGPDPMLCLHHALEESLRRVGGTRV